MRIEGDQPVPASRQDWGTIKALYRNRTDSRLAAATGISPDRWSPDRPHPQGDQK